MNTVKIFLLLIATSAFGQQLTDVGKYNWEFVMKHVKENKDVTVATKKIIAEIAGKYDAGTEQQELIEFYRNAYDFKIVDNQY